MVETSESGDTVSINDCKTLDHHVQLNGVHNGSLSPAVDLSVSKRKRKPVDRGPVLTPEKKKPKPKKQRETEVEFDAVWICVECKEAECMMDPTAEDLLICDGQCRRLFHYPCAGLSALPAEDEPFVCTDCRDQKHICSFCSNYGMDNIDVFKCRKISCGLFFHESCLAMQNVIVDVVNVAPTKKCDPLTSGGLDTVRTTPDLHFTCPAHTCWTCTQIELKEMDLSSQNNSAPVDESRSKCRGKNRSRKKPANLPSCVFESKPESFLTRCLECPIAYHISCIPPSARFHELATLCHEHSETCKLPELDPEVSIQERIERKIDAKFEDFVDQTKRRIHTYRKGKNPFFPGVSVKGPTKRESEFWTALETQNGDSATSDVRPDPWSFCLPCDYKDEVHTKPPNYRHVHGLQIDPSNRPPRIPVSKDVCQCVDVCGNNCINKTLYTECVGDPTQQTTNCGVGPKCGNRQLGQRKAAKCKPQREHGKGWGLCVVSNVKKGDLVQEYVGEVIDAKTKELRLLDWTQEHPNDTNFYVMELQPGWFIDARDVANLSRFINHSCNPNCTVLQINVNGRMRCGIFALRDIESNEFLSYDYHFDTQHGDRFVCCCGAPNCRGTMKGGSGAGTNQHKSKTELFDEAKANYERDKKFISDFYEDREARCNQVGIVVPGADIGNSNDELVSNGPHSKHKSIVRSHRIFLWRNAVQGSDFASRFARLSKR